MELCCLARAAYSDAKHNFVLHYILAAAILIFSPLLFNAAEYNERQAAQPLEIIISLIGIILITPIFLPEQNESICDVVRSKKLPYLCTCLMRLFFSLIILICLIGGFILYMKYCNSQVTFRLFCGTVATALALGSIGFFAAGISNNVIIGYMASIFYYIMNFSLKDKLGNFYLFSMIQGSFEEKKWLCVLSVALIISTFAYLKLIKKR